MYVLFIPLFPPCVCLHFVLHSIVPLRALCWASNKEGSVSNQKEMKRRRGGNRQKSNGISQNMCDMASSGISAVVARYSSGHYSPVTCRADTKYQSGHHGEREGGKSVKYQRVPLPTAVVLLL